MRNGAVSLLCFLLPLFMEDLAFIATVRSSMPFSICCEADALGACFPTNCPLGKQCITISVCGRGMVSGNGFIQHFASKCVKRWGVKLNQARASLIAKVSKPSVCVALVAMTQARKSKGV